MTTLLALLIVGAGSLAFRALPLVGAARIPDEVSRVAGWAGVAVLTAVAVRGVLEHRDGSIPYAVPVAVVATAVALTAAVRGRSMLTVLGIGAGSYLVLAAVLGAVT
jgi:branched-subunit amino acid transport protein